MKKYRLEVSKGDEEVALKAATKYAAMTKEQRVHEIYEFGILYTLSDNRIQQIVELIGQDIALSLPADELMARAKGKKTEKTYIEFDA